MTQKTVSAGPNFKRVDEDQLPEQHFDEAAVIFSSSLEVEVVWVETKYIAPVLLLWTLI